MRPRGEADTTTEPRREAEIANELAALSTAEILCAMGADRRGHGRSLSPIVRRIASRAAHAPSLRLGRSLARFDALIDDVGISRAARASLASFGAKLSVDGAVRLRGPLLVVTNHPGAYDALAMLAGLGRDDVALVAADRPFLRAMPSLARHLVFVDDAHAFDRLSGLRRALAWLAEGGALVQFGAGAIEPDACFVPGGSLGAWSGGTGVLAQRASALGAAVVPAFTSGVHSPRAKALRLVRWAEERGITTIAPLIQATIPGFRDVSVRLRIGAALGREAFSLTTHVACTEMLRAAVGALTPSRHE